ncbi:MAG: prolyl oligopeptidase family serine peptidase [Deltaproteobacteria bacterium]|nr:prolyl oligopeptidase family serine peptidase [Deltaproteobacteria bacterium]
MTWHRPPITALALVSLLACGPLPAPGGDDAGVAVDAASPDAGVDPDLRPELIAERPYADKIPSDYDGTTALPLLLSLHGLGSSGLDTATRIGLIQRVDSRGYLLAYPDGTTINGQLGWNASCCGALYSGVDDVTYLRAVLADMATRYRVDPRRVFVVGVSNGAFMAHLLACQAAERIAAIATHAGTMFAGEPDSCAPSQAVAVRHSHGTADETVAYNGGAWIYGMIRISYLGAPEVVEVWRDRNGCGTSAVAGSADLDLAIAGEETLSSSYADGCRDGQSVDLYAMQGSSHIPAFNPSYVDGAIDFLYAHPKPGP